MKRIMRATKGRVEVNDPANGRAFTLPDDGQPHEVPDWAAGVVATMPGVVSGSAAGASKRPTETGSETPEAAEDCPTKGDGGND